jgi:D-aminopeptidase
VTVDIRVLNDFAIGALFDATIEATEEAIVNALVGATTMTGRDGITAHALPHDRLLETMAQFGRPAGRSA